MKIFYAVFLILLTGLVARGQGKPNPVLDPEARIVKFYPNPAITQITFDFQKAYDKNFSFQIFNFIGKKVFELSSLSSPKTTVDLTDFFRGLYIFQLKDKNGKMIESGKFEVSK